MLDVFLRKHRRSSLSKAFEACRSLLGVFEDQRSWQGGREYEMKSRGPWTNELHRDVVFVGRLLGI